MSGRTTGTTCPACEATPKRPAQLMCRGCEGKIPGKLRTERNRAWRAYEAHPTLQHQIDYQKLNEQAVEAVRAKLGMK